MNDVKTFIKADRGRLTQVIEYGTDKRRDPPEQ